MASTLRVLLRRLTPFRVACGMALLVAVLATLDLGIIAFGAVAAAASSVNDPTSLLVDLGAVLVYFTFYPAVFVAALTLMLGILVVWRRPDARQLGVALMAAGVLSAIFVVMILAPRLLG
ncbi:MAG: hypothetical protein JWM49_1814 [Microbacteriaceae bacterium]|nr:hypothetical protein [Microbacteriaceae bacterium]